MEVSFQVDEWGEYMEDGDHLVFCMSLGNNFVVNAKEGNEEGQDFYILYTMHKNYFHSQKSFQMTMGARVLCM
jgi:hypothetical protein